MSSIKLELEIITKKLQRKHKTEFIDIRIDCIIFKGNLSFTYALSIDDLGWTEYDTIEELLNH